MTRQAEPETAPTGRTIAALNTRAHYAFNRTRQAFLASDVFIANTHWTRLRGLIGTSATNFPAGRGIWIVPCRGVHTFAMRFPIDVIYLDAERRVVHIEENVKPWRITPVRMDTETVIEVPSHTVWDSGTTVGDQIEIERMGTKGTE